MTPKPPKSKKKSKDHPTKTKAQLKKIINHPKNKKQK